MSADSSRAHLQRLYDEAAQAYMRKASLELFGETAAQATQRKITLESLDLVRARRPDVHFFNELLVQYPLPRRKKLAQVVPDNMVVMHSEPIEAKGSYDIPLQPVGPLWVLDYTCQDNLRKDYDENRDKYEHELKVPYYLLFTPHEQEVTLYRHTGKRYVSVPPNDQGRIPLPELELEMTLLDGWVRYWFRSELLPLPGDLLAKVDELHRQLREARRQRDEAAAEAARLRAELEALRKQATRDR